MVNSAATTRPYGTWDSPISAADVAAAGGGPQWVETHEAQVWWAQARPSEGGRLALLRRTEAGTEEVLPAPWNVRNRVHEYGGRPYTLLNGQTGTRVVFTHWDDQRLYMLDADVAGATPLPLTPSPEREQGVRYAEPVASPDGREVWCVRETSTGKRPTDIERALVAVPLSGAASGGAGVRIVAATHHFLSGPQPSPDGRRLAWLGWDHPAMPWDGTELCVAELSPEGVAGRHRVVAGGPNAAVCQFSWADDTSLYALNDPTGWWNLYRVSLDGTAHNLAPTEAELGGPMWVLGSRWFAPLGGGRHLVLRAGAPAVLDESSGTVTDVDTGPHWTAFAPQVTTIDGAVVSLAAGPRTATAVVHLDVDSGEVSALTPQPAELPDAAYLPVPQSRVFTGPDGRRVPAFVYPPTNPEHTGPEEERPPYLVHAHGGPTGAASPTLSLGFAYFTSRGIGVVAVNYGGSTGYGRAYRERLLENWGVVDVADCSAVAEALAAEGSADPDRLAVRGGSAGGWTTAASLTSVSTFRCGTAMCPILDLTSWTESGGETHDFESQYVTGLIGNQDEHPERYRERSPINHTDRLAGPILFLQGLEDEICPPAQCERFVAELAGSGIAHAYITFPGEQHGFRRAESIRALHEAELGFYGAVLGFTPEDVPVLELRH